METVLGSILMLGIFLGYPILQFKALRRLTGYWWYFGLVPLLALVAVLPVTIQAHSAGSNLWPLMLILTAMAATVYLFILLGVRRLVEENFD